MARALLALMLLLAVALPSHALLSAGDVAGGPAVDDETPRPLAADGTTLAVTTDAGREDVLDAEAVAAVHPDVARWRDAALAARTASTGEGPADAVPGMAPAATDASAVPGDGPGGTQTAPQVVVGAGRAAPFGGYQEFTYRCAEGNTVGPVAVPVGGNGEDITVMGCPIRVYDRTYAFGNPQVVVNEEDPTQVAFVSLHGGPTDDGRADYSRNGQAFTAFTSSDEGVSWADQPTSGGMAGGSNRGELPDIAMDSGGNMYISYLWSQPLGDGLLDSVLGFFKAGTTEDRDGVLQSYGDPHYILGREEGNAITNQGIVQLPAHVPLKEVEVNETQEPTTEDENGQSAIPDLANATEERIVTVWHERAVDWQTSTTNKSAWIDAAWTDLSGRNHWERLNKTELIGPCRDASNPVAWEGKIYVACVVERGYSERMRARVGDVDIWSIDVYTGKTEFVDKTGLDAGRVLLSVTDDGYFAVASEKRIEGEEGQLQRLSIRMAFAYHARDFKTTLDDYGQRLRVEAGGSNVPLRDAHVTGLVTATQNKVTLLSYQEWHDDPQDITQEEPDPSAPISPIGDRLTDFNKYVVGVTECGPTETGAKFELGQAVDQFNADNYATSNGRIFNDAQDGFFVTEDPRTGEELIYFAVNDYGAVQFGAIVASDAMGTQTCFPVPPLPPPPPAAIPAAAGLTSPYAGILSAGIAVPMVAGIAYLLTVKRRVAQFVTAEDE